MKLAEYQVKSKETAVYPNIGKNFIYPVLGLVGEIAETIEKVEDAIRQTKETVAFNGQKVFIVNYKNLIEIEKELGDIFWYIAQVATEYGIGLSDSLSAVVTSKNFIHDTSKIAGNIAEVTKKIMRDKQNIPDASDQQKIEKYLYQIIFGIINSCNTFGYDFEIVLQKNIDKLFSRKERNQLHGSGDNR